MLIILMKVVPIRIKERDRGRDGRWFVMEHEEIMGTMWDGMNHY